MKRRSFPRRHLGILLFLDAATVNESISPQAQKLLSLCLMRST